MTPTPGPWTVGVGLVKQFGRACFSIGIPGEPWTPIAAISLPDDVSEQDRANANLIAAAPDMLNALKAALPVLEFEFSDTADLVRAVIKKAEQGQ